MGSGRKAARGKRKETIPSRGERGAGVRPGNERSTRSLLRSRKGTGGEFPERGELRAHCVERGPGAGFRVPGAGCRVPLRDPHKRLLDDTKIPRQSSNR